MYQNEHFGTTKAIILQSFAMATLRAQTINMSIQNKVLCWVTEKESNHLKKIKMNPLDPSEIWTRWMNEN